MANSIWDWSTTAASNASADSEVNWAEGQTAASVNDSARAMMRRIAQFLDDLGAVNTASGTNAITVTTASPFSALASGLVFAFKAANTNTAAMTLAANGLTAKAIRKFDGSGEGDLVGGEVVAGGVYIVRYDASANSAAGAWVLLNPAVTINQATLRLTSSTDVDLTSTAHALQIGSSSGANLAADSNEIQARNNGVAATLFLNQAGGPIDIGGPALLSDGTASDPGLSFSADTNTGLYRYGADIIGVTVGGSYRFQFNSASFLVNYTSAPSFAAANPGVGVEIGNGVVSACQSDNAAINIRRDGSDGRILRTYRGSSNVGGISVTATATTFDTSSDYRLKDTVADYTDSGTVLDALRPVSFRWKINGENDIGFIAHEVQAVVPTAVVGAKDAVDEDGNPMYQGGDWSKLVPFLVAEVKSLRARVAALETAV